MSFNSTCKKGEELYIADTLSRVENLPMLSATGDQIRRIWQATAEDQVLHSAG